MNETAARKVWQTLTGQVGTSGERKCSPVCPCKTGAVPVDGRYEFADVGDEHQVLRLRSDWRTRPVYSHHATAKADAFKSQPVTTCIIADTLIASLKAEELRAQIARDFERAFQVTGIHRAAADPGDEQPEPRCYGPVLVEMQDELPTLRPVVKTTPWRCPGCGATEGAVHPETCPKVRAARNGHPWPLSSQAPALLNLGDDEPVLTIPPSRPCYVCDADTGVLMGPDHVPLCVGCR